MAEKEFNLTMKCHALQMAKDCHKGVFYYHKDVKEFIKRLKDELVCPNCGCCSFCKHETEIDKLAGDKLIS